MNKLIWILGICLGLAACGGNGTKKNVSGNVGQAQLQERNERVEILYFHGKQRCATCVAIEKNAKEAVEKEFAEELKNGSVVFKSIDISIPENEKIADKYEVTWSSLFVCAGIVPNSWIEWAVGGNSLLSNFFASFTGAFMYFATLTEVPIIQGLLASGMGKGPALALLLAGPSLSLPNMLVIRGVLGTQKTVVYVVLVIIMATLSGFVFGNLFG